MRSQALTEILQVPRSAAVLTVILFSVWYRSDDPYNGLWFCLLALAVFACAVDTTLSSLASRVIGFRGANGKAGLGNVVLKALGGGASGTMSSMLSAMFVTVVVLAFFATCIRTILPVRDNNWWRCIAVALMALNTVAALPPALLVAAIRWTKLLDPLAPNLKSPEKLIRSLYTSSIILSTTFLDRGSAKQELELLKEAQIQVLFVESRDGPDAEKAMSKTILAEADGQSLPLLVKLLTVLDAKENADHPGRDVYILLNDAPMAIVTGMLQAQLRCLPPMFTWLHPKRSHAVLTKLQVTHPASCCA